MTENRSSNWLISISTVVSYVYSYFTKFSILHDVQLPWWYTLKIRPCNNNQSVTIKKHIANQKNQNFRTKVIEKCLGAPDFYLPAMEPAVAEGFVQSYYSTDGTGDRPLDSALLHFDQHKRMRSTAKSFRSSIVVC